MPTAERHVAWWSRGGLRTEAVCQGSWQAVPEEFKKDAVDLVLSSPERPVADIARSLRVHKATLGTWGERELGQRRKATGDDGGDAKASREADALNAQVGELDRLLSKRNHELAHARQGIDILQKSVAYFTRETGQ